MIVFKHADLSACHVIQNIRIGVVDVDDNIMVV